MSATIKCDGCGKEEPMVQRASGGWTKPQSWYQRADADGIQDACSRECIVGIAEKTGKTDEVLPW